MHDLPFWLALNCISVLGARRIQKLLQYCQGNAQAAFTLRAGQLTEAGLPPKVVDTILREREKIDPFRELERCHSLGVQVLTLKKIPCFIKRNSRPPPVLYYRGQIECNGCRAVVGSRKATAYGKTTAEKLVMTWHTLKW